MAENPQPESSKPPKTNVPMEPMDSYLCVLLKMGLIQKYHTYTQLQICTTISENSFEFHRIYNDMVRRLEVKLEFEHDLPWVDVLDKEEDCGEDPPPDGI